MRAHDLTLDSLSADDACPTRGSRHIPAAPVAEAVVPLTRAELRRRAQAAAALAAPHVDTERLEDAAPAAFSGNSDAPAPATPVEPAAPFEPSVPTSLAESLAHEGAAILAAALPRRRRSRVANAQPDAADTPAPATETTPASEVPEAFAAPASDDECIADEFAYAARLFSFTAQTPVVRPEPSEPQAESAAVPLVTTDVVRVVSRRRRTRGVSIQRVAAGSFSIAAMAVAGLLAVGVTTPASVVAAASASTADITAAAPTEKTRDIQAFVSSSKDKAAALDRPADYDVASMADLAADSGVTMFAGTWVNNPTALIQWPFPVGVPVSAAYGSNTYLSQFSSPHRGVDLTPGAGADVHAVAAGTVSIATEAGADYGVTVVIDHVIDGQLVKTRYAHMQHGSLAVQPGDVVTAGQLLGKVGETGKATGPHLHLEVLLGGSVYTDPIAWLEEYTSGTHTVG
jgi:murein DD-endopeptidase MepM/ murein hydrolase activator NlpD